MSVLVSRNNHYKRTHASDERWLTVSKKDWLIWLLIIPTIVLGIHIINGQTLPTWFWIGCGIDILIIATIVFPSIKKWLSKRMLRKEVNTSFEESKISTVPMAINNLSTQPKYPEGGSQTVSPQETINSVKEEESVSSESRTVSQEAHQALEEKAEQLRLKALAADRNSSGSQSLNQAKTSASSVSPKDPRKKFNFDFKKFFPHFLIVLLVLALGITVWMTYEWIVKNWVIVTSLILGCTLLAMSLKKRGVNKALFASSLAAFGAIPVYLYREQLPGFLSGINLPTVKLSVFSLWSPWMLFVVSAIFLFFSLRLRKGLKKNMCIAITILTLIAGVYFNWPIPQKGITENKAVVTQQSDMSEDRKKQFLDEIQRLKSDSAENAKEYEEAIKKAQKDASEEVNEIREAMQDQRRNDSITIEGLTSALDEAEIKNTTPKNTGFPEGIRMLLIAAMVVGALTIFFLKGWLFKIFGLLGLTALIMFALPKKWLPSSGPVPVTAETVVDTTAQKEWEQEKQNLQDTISTLRQQINETPSVTVDTSLSDSVRELSNKIDTLTKKNKALAAELQKEKRRTKHQTTKPVIKDSRPKKAVIKKDDKPLKRVIVEQPKKQVINKGSNAASSILQKAHTNQGIGNAKTVIKKQRFGRY